MTTATLLRQLRILEIIIICILAQTLEAKNLKTQQELSERTKRGFGHYGGNDFVSSAHVSSSVIQIGDEHTHSLDTGSSTDTSLLAADHSAGLDSSGGHFDTSSLNAGHSSGLDSIRHLDSSSSNINPWTVSGHSSGYDVWLEPLPNYHSSSGLDTSSVHLSSIPSIHPGSDHVTNTVFSGDAAQSAHFELPSSQLHTQISSSSSSGTANIGGDIHDHGAVVAISDNIDFHNVDDIKGKHYSKSYGK